MKEQALARMNSLSGEFETNYLMDNGDHKIIAMAVMKDSPKIIQRNNSAFYEITLWHFSKIKTISDEPSESGSEWTGIKVDLSKVYQRSVIKKAKINLKQNPVKTIGIYELSPEGDVVGQKIGELENEVDLVSLVLQNRGEPVYLAMPQTIDVEDISLDVEYKPSDELLKGQKYFDALQDKFLSCSFDILSGAPYMFFSVLNLGGERFPLSLKVLYDFLNPTNALQLNSGLGEGWYTNFHQMCYPEELEEDGKKVTIYNYIDSTRIKHVFRQAIHSDSIWVDTQGTGLMLEKSGDGIKIYDENGNFSLFDHIGRLTEISLHKGANEDFKNTVEYLNDSGKISSITDGMGRIVVFDYVGHDVHINLDGEEKLIVNSADVPGFHFMNNGEEYLYYAIHSSENSQAIVLPNQRMVLFSYENGKIKYTHGLLKDYTFEYEYFLTLIKTFDVKTWAYSFNEMGENLSTYEIKEFNDYSAKYTNRNKLEYGSGSISEKKFIQFQGQQISGAGVKSETIQSSGLPVDDFYVFSAAFSYEGSLIPIESEAVIELKDEKNNILCTLSFNTKNKAVQVRTNTFRLRGNTSLHAIYRTYITGNHSFFNVNITPIHGTLEVIASNHDTGDGGIQYGGSDNEKYYYVKENQEFLAYHPDNTFDQIEAPLYANDYFANERNYQTSKNGVWNMWYDNRRKMVANVTKVQIIEQKAGIVFFEDLSKIKFTLLSLGEHIMNAITRSHASEDQEQFEQNGKEVTSYMRQTNISYTRETPVKAISHYEEVNFFDRFQNILATRDPKKEVNNNYTYEGYFASTRVQSLEKFEDNIEEWWGYLDNYLTSTHSYYLDKEIITEMSYDKMGNMIKSINPQKLEKNIKYDNYGVDITNVSAIIYGDENSNEIQYSDGQISALINDHKTKYQFTYDTFDRVTSISINEQGYAEISYAYSSGDFFYITKINYGNGQTVERTCDSYGNLVRVESIGADGNSENECSYYYGDAQDTSYLPDMNKVDSSSKLKKVYDNFVQSIFNYNYDDYGNLSDVHERIDGDYFSEYFYYDDRRRLSSYKYSLDRNIAIQEYYEYETGNNAYQDVVKATEIVINPNINYQERPLVDARLKFETFLDSLDRIEREEIELKTYPDFQYNPNEFTSNHMTKRFSYAPRTVEPGMGSGTTNFIEKESITFAGDGGESSKEIEYTYDLNGNITSIKRDGKTIEYRYDDANRLLSEKNPFLKKRFSYTYDTSGNITLKSSSNYPLLSGPMDVEVYQYDEEFPDHLDIFGLNKFEYDECGNPTLCKGIKIDWTRGRLLSNYFYEENRHINFQYDANGIMVHKNKYMYGSTYLGGRIYFYRNGRLLCEGISKMNTYLSKTEYDYIYYYYNQTGIFGFRWNDVTYYYVKDYRGDILEIRKASDNSLVASYEYDAWGNHIVYDADGNENTDPDFIGNFNPFRYRGYYYDTDLKMYYLITRWYDPEIGRFINMDQITYLDPETVNGLNLYAYCGNNPVMGYDPMGTSLFGFIAVAIISFAILLVLSGDSQRPLINREDLNINGDNPEGYINISITESYILIEDSYKIDEEKKMREILRFVMEHEDYIKYGYNRSMKSYIQEWQAHNFVYEHNLYKLIKLFYPNLPEEDTTKDVNLDKNADHFSKAYGLFSFLYRIFG